MNSSERIVALAFIAQAFLIPGFCADKKSSKPLAPAEIAKRAAAATVAIHCVMDGKIAAADVSGFLVSENGEIVTSLRSVALCRQITVRMASGDVYDAVSVVDLDLRRDLVILRVKAASLPALTLGDSNALEVGQTLYLPGPTVQKGLLSGFRQMDGYKLLQLSVAVDQGSAGGPVLDDQGRAVAIAAKPVAGADNQGFALPVNYAKGLLDTKTEMPFSALAAAVRPAPPGAKTAVMLDPPPTSSAQPGVVVPRVGGGFGGGIMPGSGGGIGPSRGNGVGQNGLPSGGAYRPGNGVTQPKLIEKVEPFYTEEARAAKWQGTVILSLVVDETGKPQNIRVTMPLGLGLDQKAIEAVSQWRFEPGKKDGKPVPVIASVEVNFRLL